MTHDDRRVPWRAAALAVLSVLAPAACGGGPSLTADAENDWTPPLGDAGEVGWRDSSVPWEPDVGWDCRFSHYVPLDVWSDGRAVYALYGSEEWEVLSGGGATLVGMFSTLAVNEGGGWHDVQSWSCDTGAFVAPCAEQLGGLVTDGMLALGRLGELLLVNSSAASIPWDELAETVANPFVVSERLAYAVDRLRVVRFDGTGWSPLPASLPIRSVKGLWAGPDELWAVGAEGDVAHYDGAGWVQHDTGSLDNWMVVWSLATDDVWVGGATTELRHYDGLDWSAVSYPAGSPTSPCAEPTVSFMWGAEGVLFAATTTSLARCTAADGCVGLADFAGSPDPGSGACTGGLTVGGLWGASPNEVYLALVDRAPAELVCGGGPGRPFFAWWDGAALHWF